MRATFIVAAAVALAALATAVGQGQASTTQADPHYCVIVKDGQGRPIYTVCVPWPLGAASDATA